MARDATNPLVLSKEIAEAVMIFHFENDFPAARCWAGRGVFLLIVLGRELSFVLVWELIFFIRFELNPFVDGEMEIAKERESQIGFHAEFSL